MRERHRHQRGADNSVGRNGNSERHDRGQRRDSDLNLSAALIASRALLQTGVLVCRAVAVRFLECHRRPRLFNAGLRNTQPLGKEQRSDKQPGE